MDRRREAGGEADRPRRAPRVQSTQLSIINLFSALATGEIPTDGGPLFPLWLCAHPSRCVSEMH